MCGIAGYVDYSTRVKRTTLRSMRDQIHYRGPDSAGEFYSKDKVAALGIRRLSILDLKTGDQPIQNEDKSITVVYNGEIYNYLGIKKDLIKKGHKFRTTTDTEILVHLYEEYSEKMVKYLNGMFAFALWDENTRKLFIARDRSGVKPLYFFQQGKLLVFGSEVKTILKHPLYKKNIDPTALDLYCYIGYVPHDRSIFSKVKKLLPGHSITFSESGIKINKYFEIDFDKETDSWSLDDLLRKAVTSQLQADVPVGVFLSGGLDSSLISYYVTESKKKMKSFSISFDEESFDESIYARSVADKLGTEHYEESFSVHDVPKLFEEITDQLDEPFADASLLPTYKVSRLAKRYVKVALSGDGGDELFGGYPTYQGQIMAEFLKHIPKLFINAGLSMLDLLPTSDGNYPRKTLAKVFAKSIKMKPFERQIFIMGTFFLGEHLFRGIPSFDELKNSIPLKTDMNVSEKARLIDYYTYLRDDLLLKSDRASMFNSLEVRVPYLDNDLIDFAFSNNKKHVNIFRTKIMLRDLAMKKLDMPEIANRPKKGFGIPVSKWLKHELKDFGYDALNNKKLADHLDKDKIAKVWDDHQQGKQNNGGAIWLLIVLSEWLNKWA